MGRKRLITDSYPVVKRREGPAGHSKGELASELGEEPQPRDEEEAELELLRQFDLAWQYGPCTASGISIPYEAPRMTSCPWFSCSSPKNLRTEARAHCSCSAQPRCGGTLGRQNLEVSEAQLLHLTSRLSEPPWKSLCS
nr:DNA polymerase delta subunit 4 isoform X1 [Macaca nemestrina]